MARSRFGAWSPSSASIVWIGIGAVVLIGAGFALGLGGALLLAGTWALACGLGRLIPRVGAPTSWALALITELFVVLGLSGAGALVSPRAHDAAWYLVILLIPGLIGVALVLIGNRTGRGRAPTHPFFDRIAIIITGAVVGGYAALSARGPSYDVAWALSGDARNHLLVLRSVLSDGGITLAQVRSYPAAINAISSVVSGSSSRSGLADGDLMLHDMRALATVYVLLVVAIATMIVAILAMFLERQVSLPRWHSVSLAALFLVAASLAVSPLLLGTALFDGAFSAYGGLAVSLASVVIAFAVLKRPSGVIHVFLAPASLLAFVSWTVLAVVPVMLAIAVPLLLGASALRAGRKVTLDRLAVGRLVLYGAPVLAAIIIGIVLWANRHALETVFVVSGSIRPVSVWLLPMISLVLVGFVLVADGRRRRMAIAALAVVAGTAVVVVWMMHLPSGWSALSPTYYSQKTLWLVCCSLVWVPFAPLVVFLERTPAVAPVARRACAAGLAAVVVVLGLSLTTPAQEPLSAAGAGWSQPSAPVISKVAHEADKVDSFVIWSYSAPGDDRLGNFWAAFAWTTTPAGRYVKGEPLAGGFAYWAYFETGQVQDLCPVVDAYPNITIVTALRDARDRISTSCGAGPYRVDLVKPPDVG